MPHRNAFERATSEQLMAFWARYHRPSRRDAEALCGARFPGYTNVAATFANYACNLAVLRGCRERGDSQQAIDCYEHSVVLCFRAIPQELRHVLDEYVFPETDEQRSK